MKCCSNRWFWRNAVFLTVGVSLVAYFVSQNETISKNVIPDFNPKIEALPKKDLEVVRGEMREGYGLDTLIAVTPAKLAQGKELYSANCMGCHGADGKGNPALGSRDLTNPKGGTWLNGTHFVNLFSTLSKGVGKMPAFGQLSVPERVAIIHYIESLGDYAKPDAGQKQALEDQFGLSKAAKSPNQVPVELAIEKMIEEVK